MYQLSVLEEQRTLSHTKERKSINNRRREAGYGPKEPDRRITLRRNPIKKCFVRATGR